MKRMSRGQLVKKLDSAFSQWVRLRLAKNGEAMCVTCGVVKPWKELQAGHFYTRGRYPTRWHPDNVHVQCYRCNVLLKGNYITYTKYMINRYGMEFVDELEVISLSSETTTSAWIREQIEYYQGQVAELSKPTIQSTVKGIDKTPWGVLE